MPEQSQKILCRAIIELVGKPKEHVEKAMNTVIDSIKEKKGIKLQNKDIAPVKKVEAKGKDEEKIQKTTGELFSTFAEIEFLADSVKDVSAFCFEFLPSSIEIIEPEKLSIGSIGLADFLNEAMEKIHSADMVVKTLRLENNTLRKNALSLLRNMIMVSLSKEDQTIEQLSKHIGIPVGQLKGFLSDLVKDNLIKEENKIYKPIKK